ncbi:MAG TPA: metallophosphoesterase [Flavisolibacter sp.]|jgi:predicted phosphodiesterase|nr:metallophosphoesterase [Flavisolibacter sp.]
MRKLLRRFLLKPVLALSNKYASRPDRERVYAALSGLLSRILNGETKKGPLVSFDLDKGKLIIFSDQHKGIRDGADDFMLCEPNYLTALEYYREKGFHYIALGDCEELWENTWTAVKKQQRPSFEKEKPFIYSNSFTKIFGNHDLFWDNDPFAALQLKEIYGTEVPVYEGVVFETMCSNKKIRIFCTHGHQGDVVSDGNWFSKFFVSKIWAPLQSYLQINPNTPAYDAQLKTLHNAIMYEWSAQQENLFLITGHTHQPVFESLTYIERLYRQLQFARKVKDSSMEETLQKEIRLRKFEYSNISEDYMKLKPSYFNSGCCCFSDGDITGIEIEQNCFRLVKWHSKEGASQRIILEETPLEELVETLAQTM